MKEIGDGVVMVTVSFGGLRYERGSLSGALWAGGRQTSIVAAKILVPNERPSVEIKSRFHHVMIG